MATLRFNLAWHAVVVFGGGLRVGFMHHPMAWGAPRSQGLALVRNRHARGTTDRGPTG